MQQFPEDITSSRSTPADLYLFDVDKHRVVLSKKYTEIFHKITTKLFCVYPRRQPDLQVAASFLTTRFSCPNVGDWTKLKRVL